MLTCGFRQEQAEARNRAATLAWASCRTSRSAASALQVAGAVGFGGGLYDSAMVRVYPTGVVRVYIGGKPHGQGEETTFAQIVADEFGYPVENVEIVAGDTETTPQGWGAYGAGRRRVRLSSEGRGAAGEGESEEDRRPPDGGQRADVEWKDGKFSVRARPGTGKGFAEVALMANVRWNVPGRRGAGPRGQARSSIRATSSFPFGAPSARSRWTSTPARSRSCVTSRWTTAGRTSTR